MSKLFKLKEWFTLEEAAKHLSLSFGEDVSIPDVIRLGLDRHLTISIIPVNKIRVKKGNTVPIEEATRKMIPEFIPDFLKEKAPIYYLAGTRISETECVLFENSDVVSVSGIWDLPMLGGEVLDLEFQYHELTGGPTLELETLDGTFIEEPNSNPRVICEVQEHFENNEFSDKLPNPERKYANENYYPAGGLPQDCIFVVRRESLTNLLNSLDEHQPSEPSQKSKNVYSKTIYTLSKALIGSFSGKKTKDAAAVLAALDSVGLKHPINQKSLADILEDGRELVE